MSVRYYKCFSANMHLLCQGFRKLSSDRQIEWQTDTAEIHIPRRFASGQQCLRDRYTNIALYDHTKYEHLLHVAAKLDGCHSDVHISANTTDAVRICE